MENNNSPAEDIRKDYFEDIPYFLKATRRFIIKADERCGRIPITRIENWQEFSRLLSDPFFTDPSKILVFRGQRRFDWSLMPTLGRLTENGIITKELTDKQLMEFRKAIRGRLRDYSSCEDDDELWAIGQHHGLLTPLLDWSTSPYVALFFAFEQPDSLDEKDNEYRVVYVLDTKFIEAHSLKTGIRLIEPKRDYYGRLVNQAGLFTHSPFGNTIEGQLATILADGESLEDEELLAADADSQPDILAKYLCKIFIPNVDRKEILKHLRLMNVHHASLFPDLLGASAHCNSVTEEHITTDKIRKADNPTTTQEAIVLEVNDLSVSTDITSQIILQDTNHHSQTVWPEEEIHDILIADIVRNSFHEKYQEQSRYPLDLENNLPPLTYYIGKFETTDWYQRDSQISSMRVGITTFLRQQKVPYNEAYALAKDITERLKKARENTN